MALLPANQRDQVRADLQSVQATRANSIVALTRRAREQTQQVWRRLYKDLQLDALLTTLPAEHKLSVFELFGHRYRHGTISKSGKPV